jgi:hypothetical protein
VLESQFDEEINSDHLKQSKEARDLKKDASPVESEGSDRSSGMHSRSSSGSGTGFQPTMLIRFIAVQFIPPLLIGAGCKLFFRYLHTLGS